MAWYSRPSAVLRIATSSLGFAAAIIGLLAAAWLSQPASMAIATPESVAVPAPRMKRRREVETSFRRKMRVIMDCSLSCRAVPSHRVGSRGWARRFRPATRPSGLTVDLYGWPERLDAGPIARLTQP